VVSRVRAALPEARILVVDDGSTDDTAGRARAAGAQVLRVDRNGGKGRALAAGLAAAVSGGATVVATLDADGQHPAGLLPDLVAPVAAGDADLVLGARHRAGTMPWQRRLSNWLSAVLATRIAGMPVADAQTGFRAMRREVAERIRPAGRRYEWELAFLIEALRAGYRLVSVSVPTVYQGEVSHFRSVSDTWRIARVFARYSRQILFGAP
jgi:glycosyltransferase involved in cell wall biosynthesis